MEILIVAATPAESCGLFEQLGFPVFYTGIGKLNAFGNLLHLAKQKKMPKPKYILNLGTVGSVHYEPNTVLNVKEFLERDMTFGLARLKAIGLPISFGHLESVSCGTGDSFLSENGMKISEHLYRIVDMEGYALALACQFLETDFVSIKCVSDSGDAKEWKDNLPTTATKLYEEASHVIGKLLLLLSDESNRKKPT